MADEEQLKILKQGVEVWNAWREENPGVVVDLSDADLEFANLTEANLSGAHLSGADLRCAHLSGARLFNARLFNADLSNMDLTSMDLSVANLSRASLIRANLVDANLNGTYLFNADLRRADLNGANLTNADLTNATFDRATIGDTTFANVDLSTALDLETVRHHSPSTIGIDTLYKSGGKIPESFLRDCGVPDSFINQVKALIGAEEGMQFYSCFISYSGVDEEFARRLHGRLQQAHVRVWFAPEDLHSGQKLHEQIDEAIRVFDKLLIVLSPNSLKSEWVKTELRKARKRERQHGKRKLFPLRLVDYGTLLDWECFDADHGQDLATEVREYFIPDFTNWKDHDAFEAAFARLLKDLRATDLKAVA